MKNIFPIIKLTERKTLVERRRDDGTIIEYIICTNLTPVENGEPNEYYWDHGEYSFTLEGIIKTAALKCFKPIYMYVVVEAETGNEIMEIVFDDYDKAHKYAEKRFMYYRDCGCVNSEYKAGINEEIGTVWFDDNTEVQIKLFEIRV